MSYLWPAGLAQDYRYNIEAAGAVLDMVNCEEISGGPLQPVFFCRSDGILDFGEFFIRPGSDLDKDDAALVVNHHQVYLTGLAGKISREDF